MASLVFMKKKVNMCITKADLLFFHIHSVSSLPVAKQPKQTNKQNLVSHQGFLLMSCLSFLFKDEVLAEKPAGIQHSTAGPPKQWNLPCISSDEILLEIVTLKSQLFTSLVFPVSLQANCCYSLLLCFQFSPDKVLVKGYTFSVFRCFALRGTTVFWYKY